MGELLASIAPVPVPHMCIHHPRRGTRAECPLEGRTSNSGEKALRESPWARELWESRPVSHG